MQSTIAIVDSVTGAAAADVPLTIALHAQQRVALIERIPHTLELVNEDLHSGVIRIGSGGLSAPRLLAVLRTDGQYLLDAICNGCSESGEASGLTMNDAAGAALEDLEEYLEWLA